MAQSFSSILGNSPAVEALIRSAQLVALTDATVLIQGESGTGKELFANALQQASLRNKQAYITVNCAALPSELAESTLFGHKKAI